MSQGSLKSGVGNSEWRGFQVVGNVKKGGK